MSGSRWLQSVLERIKGSQAVQNVAEMLATRGALLVIGMVTSVIVTRSLGPEGRGIYAVGLTVTAIGVQFLNFGFTSSNVYYVAKEPDLLPTLVGNSLIVSVGIAGGVALLAAVAAAIFPGWAPVHGNLLWISLAAVPVGVLYLLLQNLAIGTGRIRSYNAVEIGNRSLFLLLALVVIALSVAWPVTFIAVGFATGLTASLVIMRPLTRGGVKFSLDVLKRTTGYGFRSYLCALFAYLLGRIDLLMVQYIRGPVDAGYYSIALNIGDLFVMIPVTVGTLLFPVLSRTDDAALRRSKNREALVWSAAVMLPLLGLGMLMSRPIISMLFGKAFLPSRSAFLWLAPGVFFWGMVEFPMIYLASVGLPNSVLAAWVVLIASNVTANLIFLPRYGIVGAAIASSIAYFVAFVVFRWLELKYHEKSAQRG